MRQETRSIPCQAPQDELWNYLADYDHVVRMGSPGASARLAQDGPERCDRVYEAELAWHGSTSRFTACMVDAEPPETLTWDATTGMGRSSLRFDLEPIDSESTLVTVTLLHEPSPWTLALEALAWGFLCGTLERTVEELGRLTISS